MSTPRYLIDEDGFYFNPECPELGLIFNGPITINDIKQVRIPVTIYRDGKPLEPGDKLPPDVEANTLRLAEGVVA
jgi:hypothetical protein